VRKFYLSLELFLEESSMIVDNFVFTYRIAASIPITSANSVTIMDYDCTSVPSGALPVMTQLATRSILPPTRQFKKAYSARPIFRDPGYEHISDLLKSQCVALYRYRVVDKLVVIVVQRFVKS